MMHVDDICNSKCEALSKYEDSLFSSSVWSSHSSTDLEHLYGHLPGPTLQAA